VTLLTRLSIVPWMRPSIQSFWMDLRFQESVYDFFVLYMDLGERHDYGKRSYLRNLKNLVLQRSMRMSVYSF
jgi:hypothetical protein